MKNYRYQAFLLFSVAVALGFSISVGSNPAVAEGAGKVLAIIDQRLAEYGITRSAGITLAGDLSGSSAASVVDAIQGIAVSETDPTDGQAMVYSETASAWVPTDLVTDPTVGGDLSGTASVASVVAIQGRDVASTAPSTSQALVWDGSQWLPGAPTPDTHALDGATHSGTLPLADLADGATAGQPLRAGGGAGDPAYGAVDLGSTDVTGTLPLASVADDAAAGKPLTSGGAGGDPSWGTFGGDVAGTVTALVVDGLQGRAVGADAPGDGDAYLWSAAAAAWLPGAVTSDPALGGDLSGVASAGTVVKVQGIDVSTTDPVANEALVYSSTTSSYVPEGISSWVDAALGSTRGGLLYRGAAGWAVLAPGSATNLLTANGAGADPSWAAAPSDASLAATLLVGNTTGGTDVVVTAGDAIRGSGLTLDASAGNLTLQRGGSAAWVVSGTNADLMAGADNTQNIGQYSVTAGDGTFAAAVNYSVGNAPYSVTSADFDGDDVPDLASANVADDNVSILLGVGDGTFAAAVNYSVGDGLYSVTSADFDGDSVPDLASANNNADNVSILLGVGDGTFAAAVNYSAGDGPHSVTSADFDGDSVQDLAVANFFADNVSILLGVGDGTFAAAVNYSAGDGPYSVTSADFDGDSVQDLAVANNNVNNVSILLGVGDGTFAAAVNYGVGAGPYSVTSADFDGDDVPDLASANFFADNVSILLGVGDGTFAAAVNYGVGDWPQSVTSADFDGDDVPDLAVVNANVDNVSILLGVGNGTFAAAVNYSVGDEPYSVTSADFDGDSVPDLASANSFDNTVSILLGDATTTTTNMRPRAVVAGTSVTAPTLTASTALVVSDATTGVRLVGTASGVASLDSSATGTIGALYVAAPLVAHASTEAATVAQSGGWHTNTGSGGAVALTLPTVTSTTIGVTLHFVAVEDDDVTIEPPAGATILWVGHALAADEGVVLDTLGDSADLTWTGAAWAVTAEHGTLAEESP